MNCVLSITKLSYGILAYIIQDGVDTPEYIVRAYRETDNENDRVAFHVVMQHDARDAKSSIGVSHLFSSSEEELFQLACTAPFDVYYVREAINVLRDKIVSYVSPGDVQTTKEDIVLQY